MMKLLKRMKEKQKSSDQKQAMNYVVRRTEENKQGNAQEQYMNFVARVALPALREGKVGYANSLQWVFTIRDAKHYHIEVSELFIEVLHHTSAKNRVHLDEQCVNVYRKRR